MIGKVIAAIIMGIMGGLIGMILAGMSVGGGETGGSIGIWAFLVGLVLMIALALTAKTARKAWGRTTLVSGLMGFLLPLSGLLFTTVVGTQAVQEASGDAEQIGAAIGLAIGGGIVTGVLGVIGFFLGIFFVVASYFLLREKT